MKIQFLFFLFLMAFLISNGQSSYAQAPDYNAIRKVTQDTSSSQYYPTLLGRYNSLDSLLTLDEYHLLYYGFALQEDYNPYKENPALNQFMVDITSCGTIDSLKSISIIEQAHLLLLDQPFNLRVINLLAFAYECSFNQAQAAFWQKRFDSLLHVISKSGDGKSLETPIHVIFPSDEYIFLSSHGLSASGSQLQTLENPELREIDYIQVKQNDDKIEGYYFDVTRLIQTHHYKYE